MAFTGMLKTFQIIRILKFPNIINKFKYKNNFLSIIGTTRRNLFIGNPSYCLAKNNPQYQAGKEKDPNAPQTKPKKQNPLTSPEITLVSGDEVCKISLVEAEKLSKRRKLKLVRVLDYDTKTERPLYKLMSTLEYFEEEKRSKSKKAKERSTLVKEEKLLTLSTKSGEHDVETRLKQGIKLLKKRHLVRFVVAHEGNPSKVVSIMKFYLIR